MKYLKLFLLIFVLLNNANSFQSQKQYETLKFKNFKIAFERDLKQKDVNFLANKIDSSINIWKSNFKMRRTGRMEFRIYKNEKSYRNKSGVNFNQEVYLNKGIVHLSHKILDKQSLMYEKLITNAVVLALLNEPNKKGCPKWLIESFAVYVSGLKVVDEQNAIKPSGNIRDFQQEYFQLKKENQYQAFLSKSLEFINFLSKRYGIEKLYLLFKNFDGKKTEEQVFEKVFGEKYEDIESTWQNYVKKF